MPQFGLGTYKMTHGATIKFAGMKLGYKLFDCASFYKNEEMVGQAFDQMINEYKAISREDMFVISKACWDELEDVEAACRRSLENLQLDYLDLYLVHWPIAVRPIMRNGEVKFEKIKIPMYKIWE